MPASPSYDTRRYAFTVLRTAVMARTPHIDGRPEFSEHGAPLLVGDVYVRRPVLVDGDLADHPGPATSAASW